MRIKTAENGIAIIGMSCILPDAKNVSEFWDNIINKHDCIREIPETHWNVEDFYSPDKNVPDKSYSKKGGFLPFIHFDPMEFGIAPKDLEVTDSAQLLGMYVAREALEDAGYDYKKHDHSNTSCYLGMTSTTEMATPLNIRLAYPTIARILDNHDVDRRVTDSVLEQFSESYAPWQENSFPGMLGNVVAGRIANFLNLGGTNCVIDAACASASGAMKMAMDSLTTGTCDLAISGGVDAMNNVFMFMCFSKTPAFSYEGISRPFDHKSDGILIGEGIAILVLKRLADAKRDGDRIYAVLRSIGSSSDGKAAKSIYQPVSSGQAKSISRAYEYAGVNARQVELLEAHGTGTIVGDAAEFEGLRSIFTSKKTGSTKDQQWCALGSVKSQIGHTKSTAGAAGMMKAVLSLYHKVLPPTLNIEKPIENLKIETSPFYLNTEARPWARQNLDCPRIAAVSAFGFGGTNFHSVVQEYDDTLSLPLARPSKHELFVFCSESVAGLKEKINQTLKAAKAEEIDELAFFELAALNRDENRPLHKAKKACILTMLSTDLEDLRKKAEKALAHLENNSAENIEDKEIFYYPKNAFAEGKVALLFPGQGSQDVNMFDRNIFKFPFLQKLLDDFDRFLISVDRLPISRHLYPLPARSKEESAENDKNLTQTDRAQLGLGFCNAAMFETLSRMGLKADCFAGHSYGELSALYAARALSFEDYIDLTRVRGDVMYQCSKEGKGTMAAVKAPLGKIQELLEKWKSSITLANLNMPDQGVISGEKSEIEALIPKFKKEKIIAKQLPVSAAFHSPLMNDAAKPFKKFLEQLKINKPEVPVYSNVIASPYEGGGKRAAELLGLQLLNAVRFVEEIEKMYADGVRIFIECGPGNVLTNLVKNILKGKDILVLATALNKSRKRKPQNWPLSPFFNTLAMMIARQKINFNPDVLGERPQLKKKRKYSPVTIELNGANYIPEKTRKASFRKGKVLARASAKVASNTIQNQRTPEKENVKISGTTSQQKSIMAGAPGLTGQNPPATRFNQIKVRSTSNIISQNPPGQTRINSGKKPAITGRGMPLQERKAMNRNGNHLDEFIHYRQRLVEVHEQFLQLQMESNRIFEQMLHSTPTRQQLPASPESFNQPEQPPIGLQQQPVQPYFSPAPPPTPQYPVHSVPMPAYVPQPAPPLPAVAKIAAEPLVKSTNVSEFTPPQLSKKLETRPTPVAKAPVVAAKSNLRDELKGALFAIISEKTGFPEEMLNGEMDMENDLAIDSIRRVEILGAVQEKFPQAPVIDSSHLGVLNTIDQILNHLSAGEAASSSEKADASKTAKTATPGRKDEIGTELYKIIAEKTGFPVEMLNNDMDFESDLAIDSIRRVEILGAVQEQFPDAPVIDSSHLGTLNTIGQIVDFLGGSETKHESKSEVEAKEPATCMSELFEKYSIQDLTTSLLNIISEKTGFPKDMLKLDMDLETDLAIDSIRRVEILGAMQELFPKAPTIDSSKLGVLNTVEQIVEYLSQAEMGSMEKKSLLTSP
ncbi:beta-ketoacyl synthase N-terminal-like domain-containing protein [Candidatus Riflebacteria bacterium]